MRAFSSFRAACLPLRINVSSSSRSSPLSFTTYFFTAISFQATNRLRRCSIIDSKIHRGVKDGGYYRRTGIFPIMHAVVVKRELATERPELVTAIYEGFCAAKD